MFDLRSSLGDPAQASDSLLQQQGRINSRLQETFIDAYGAFSAHSAEIEAFNRQLSQELNRIDFQIINSEGEIDRSLLARLSSPLEHLIRNAIDLALRPPLNALKR